MEILKLAGITGVTALLSSAISVIVAVAYLALLAHPNSAEYAQKAATLLQHLFPVWSMFLLHKISVWVWLGNTGIGTVFLAAATIFQAVCLRDTAHFG